MAWFDEAVFYHIYPLGLTGAPAQNDYGEPVHRLNTLIPWISHLKETGFTAKKLTKKGAAGNPTAPASP